MLMTVGCKLRYRTTVPTPFLFQIEAAKGDSQVVKSERLLMPLRPTDRDTYVEPVTLNRKMRAMLGPGPVEISYEATVEVRSDAFDPSAVREFDFAELPMDTIEYLAPSRYCPSDTFTQFAFETFGSLPRGHDRVTAVCDWIYGNIKYQAGSTGSWTNAAEVFQARQGVCRDFAHLGISLTRALGIPARYASVYADRLSPQDFHAVFQAYLNGPNGGEWFMFDATRMSSVDALVRIAAGRDAADVAFAWPQGTVESDPPEVWAGAGDRPDATRTDLAVSA